MEKLGVPTAVVVTEPFISSAKAMALAHGMPDYPFAVIPHPIAATEREELEERAERVVNEVISILSTGEASSGEQEGVEASTQSNW